MQKKYYPLHGNDILGLELLVGQRMDHVFLDQLVVALHCDDVAATTHIS